MSFQRASTVIVGCPNCGEFLECDAHALDLTCPECGKKWTKVRLRTADETIAHIRTLLAAEQDSTRRAFYNASNLLREIATAIDAYPVLKEIAQ